MGLFGRRQPPRPSDAEIMVGRLERHVDEAETRYLDVLRRELASMVLESDPWLFERTYRKARSIASDMARADMALVEAEEAALLQRFQHFPDFELLGTWHVVPYVEGRNMTPDDAIVDRYLEVTRMLMLLRRRHPYLKDKPLFEEREVKAHDDNLKRHLDRRLRKRLEDAMRLFYAYRAGWQKGAQDIGFGVDVALEIHEIVVRHIRSPTPDVQYGISFPNTDEHGVYSHYRFDDGRVHETYDASDAAYGNRRSLLFA